MTHTGFVQLAANMTLDGEVTYDGDCYEQTVEDAYDALASLVTLARALLPAEATSHIQAQPQGDLGPERRCDDRR